MSSYTPAVSSDIASAVVSADSLKLTLANQSANPLKYKIIVADNSIITKAEPGKTYSYDFANGSVLPQTSYSSLRYNTFVTIDGLITLSSNTDTNAKKFGYHDAQHGAVFFPGNSIQISVAGNASVSFGTCMYGSATDAVFEFSSAAGTVLGSVTAQNIGKGVCGTSTFSYKGPEGVITATLKSGSFPTAEVYIHGLSVENAARTESTNGKTDVWDFGAVQLDSTLYNNKLSVAVINSWYAKTIVPGSSNNTLPLFTSGILSWVGGTNDRLRTTNTSITRYDQNIANVTDYTGRLYVNSSAATGRFLSFTLGEDNEVTLVTRTDAGGKINFQYVGDPAAQTDVFSVTELDTLTFVAKAAGIYHVFDNVGKPSYFRVYRKEATYVTLNGTVDVTQAPGLPNGYGIILKNSAGKTWNPVVSNKTFTVQIPAGFTYTLSLSGANGFMITDGTSLNVTQATTTHKVTVKKVELYTVSGAITGLDTKTASLSLVYTPDPAAKKIYVPEPVVNANAKTYSVQLEPDCRYKIAALGVNDFSLSRDTITVGKANLTANLDFVAKLLNRIFVHSTDLTEEQWAKLSLTFTNMNETGYAYTFNPVNNNVALRNGTYSIASGGLDEYPVDMELISNLKVEGEAIHKTLKFKQITLWSFDDRAIPSGTAAYRGLLFSGTVSNEVAKGHLTAKNGATIKVPVQKGDKIKVTYYYAADFSFNGGAAITTSSGSTSQFEYAVYAYPGNEPGYVTITVGAGAGTSYFPEIEVIPVMAYKSVIYVGADKEFKTINDALAAITRMDRPNNERVTVMIDPGNYEEMLVVTTPNITLKNAAVNPVIALTGKGVGIAAGAVRITSYYGHGYNYYSMGNNQKWNGDLLKVNKENGYLSYENKGAGTTNGSYWNATVVINANGFTAEDIIFENSFNQYISKKESEDVVVMWTSGGKGIRPTDYGNTKVQQRSFVERAAALAIMNNADKVVLKKCRVIGRQDTFYGGTGTRVVVYRGSVMGAVDYIFGGMTAVFYKTDLAMNTSDDSGDAAYLTAAQQSSGRGYLMYECYVVSTNPGTETASTMHAKPGYFGRPWQATTSEVVFYKTTVDVSDYTGNAGQSLISPAGWQNSLGGESKLMYEFGTIEKSGVDNAKNRASWSTVLKTPTLSDGTAINTFNFTKGNDGWDPLPGLISGDTTVGIRVPWASSSVNIYSAGGRIFVVNVNSETKIDVYSTNGMLMKSLVTGSNTGFSFKSGLWLVKVSSPDGQKTAKVVVQ